MNKRFSIVEVALEGKKLFTQNYIIDVHYSLWIQFSNKGIVFFMLMAEAPMKQPVNIGVDIRKVSHNVTWYNGTMVGSKHFQLNHKYPQFKLHQRQLQSFTTFNFKVYSTFTY